MFGSVYGKAVELFGKALVISAFLPLLAVGAALLVSLEPGFALKVARAWVAEHPSEQAASAGLVLGLLYVVAFILFGLRDSVLHFVSSGRFWILPSLRRWRRIRFTQRELDRELRDDGPALAVAQAVIWVNGGFGSIDPRYLYLPSGSRAKALEKRVTKLLDRLQNRKAQKTLTQRLPAAERHRLSELFVAMHRLSYLDGPAGSKAVARFQNLCSSAVPAIDIQSWGDEVKALDFGDIVDAYEDNVWSPPLREVQPTELGNVLVWAYSYTRKRYGIELDFVFPRLLKVIVKDYQAKIDDRQQFLDFTVLLTVLSFAGAIVYLAAVFSPLVVELSRFQWREAAGRCVLLAAWFSLGGIAYGLSIVAARAYVSIITSAVDLFRLALLDQLKIPQPKESEEAAVWKRLNQTILKGDLVPAPEPSKKRAGVWGWLAGLWKS